VQDLIKDTDRFKPAEEHIDHYLADKLEKEGGETETRIR
jgi:hypothetical protein